MASRPLLEVSTKLDEVVNDLAISSLRGGVENKTARWHFFVGSPGNGKSAATGQLARALRDKDCRILTEGKEEIGSLEPGEIPYVLHVCEGQNPFATLWIAQDASVVRDPYSAESDPALEFIKLLMQAYERRVSLVVCTNRGVIEKAFRRVYQDTAITGLPWFKAMKLAVEDKPSQSFDFESARNDRKGFQSFKFTHTKLDRRSLLIGSDTFEKIVRKATAQENWASCAECPARGRCPFYLNRDWLADAGGERNLADILRKSELFSGQIIVFREALALLSFLLAGCPRDYGSSHPCEWVHMHVEEGNIFALVSRRIYMSLFSAYVPYGLEPNKENFDAQRRALKGIFEGSGKADQRAFKSLKKVIDGERVPSPDVGVQRLLGRDGVLPKLDALNDPLDEQFVSDWEGAFRGYEMQKQFASLLERDCLDFWEAYATELESRPTAGAEENKWLQRWITAHSFRFGALALARTAYNKELGELTEIAGLAGTPMTPTLAGRLSELQKELRKMLGEYSSGVQISDFVKLMGEWPARELAPKVELSDTADRLSLVLRFPRGVDAYIPAEVYVWLSRLLEFHMSRASFPTDHLEAARDALVRAAVRSDYSITDDIEISIRLPEAEMSPRRLPEIKIQRTNGVAFVPSGDQ